MLDINKEAEKTLKKASCETVFAYPHNFAKLPCVSYYTLTETGGFYADNNECIREGHIQTDIWAKVPKECGELVAELNEIMVKDGWIMEMSRDVPEKDERIYHKTMRFKKYFTLQ